MIAENKKQKSELETIGKKGLFLRNMIKVKVLVPPAFIIVTAFESFMKETKLHSKINGIITIIKPSLNDLDSILKLSTEINKQIQEIEFPKELSDNILNEFDKLKSNYVSIRHSLVVEDSLDIFLRKELFPQLNIDRNNLIPSIKKAWSSYFSPFAITHKLKHNTNIEQPFSALLVQKMINAEVSGICFTKHPLMPESNQILIEANLGLSGNKAILSSFKDTYIVDNKKIRVISKILSPQKTMITRIDSNTKEIEVGDVDSKNQKLSDNKIVALAKIVKNIANFYKEENQRIEWVLEKNIFYIIESKKVEYK